MSFNRFKDSRQILGLPASYWWSIKRGKGAQPRDGQPWTEAEHVVLLLLAPHWRKASDVLGRSYCAVSIRFYMLRKMRGFE